MNQECNHANFKGDIDDLKPIIDQSASDSAALRCYYRASWFILIEVCLWLKLMTIPEAFAHRRDFPKKLKDLIYLCICSP